MVAVIFAIIAERMAASELQSLQSWNYISKSSGNLHPHGRVLLKELWGPVQNENIGLLSTNMIQCSRWY